MSARDACLHQGWPSKKGNRIEKRPKIKSLGSIIFHCPDCKTDFGVRPIDVAGAMVRKTVIKCIYCGHDVEESPEYERP